jgi:uncharacterized protein
MSASGQELNLEPIPTETTFREDFQRFLRGLHFKSVIIYFSAALALLLQHYLATRPNFFHIFASPGRPDQIEMFESVGWCFLVFCFYFLLPALIIKFVFKENLRDYGLSFQGLRNHWKVYAAFYLVICPVIILASTTPSFQQIYPFFKYVAASTSGLLIWELAYGAQFFAVEFFFRGYLLFGLKEKFGMYSIFIAVIPYCMIHFTKPMGESFGALFAGVILGYMALKSRSIWGGVMLHWLVAITMDVSSLLQRH